MVSIIIPCYNASKYVFICYSHLIKQTDEEWEAIFINDGSKDDTLEKLQSIANIDNRVKVFSQQNKGAAKAREYGIKHAKSKYICFLDVDDFLSYNAIKLINTIIKQANADIIVSSFNIINGDKKHTPRKITFNSTNNIEYLKQIFIGKWGWELCAKVYKKELFNKSIKTPEHIRIGEDAAVFIQLVSNASYIVGINEPIYNYIQNIDSASHIKSLKYAEETIEAAFFIKETLKKGYIYKDIQEYISPMFLLFLSNSISKGYLGNKHEYIQYIINNHLNIKSLLQIPFIKAIYILMAYFSNGYIIKLMKR